MLTRKRASDAESFHSKRVRQALGSNGDVESTRGSERAARPPPPPHDVLKSVFAFLSFRNLLAVGRVSRQWNHVAGLGTCHDRRRIWFDPSRLHTITRSAICRRHIHVLYVSNEIDVRGIHQLGYLDRFTQLYELNLEMKFQAATHPRTHALISKLTTLRILRVAYHVVINTRFVDTLLVPGFRLEHLQTVGHLDIGVLTATSLLHRLSTYLPGITNLNVNFREDAMSFNEISLAGFHSLKYLELTSHHDSTAITDRAFRDMPRDSLITFELWGLEGSESLRDWLATVPNLRELQFLYAFELVDFTHFAHAQLETFYAYPRIRDGGNNNWIETKFPRCVNNPRLRGAPILLRP